MSDVNPEPNPVWPENPTRALRRRLRVSGDCATRRYFGGRIQLSWGTYKRAVHFRIVPGASDVEGACARASLPHWAGELVPQSQSAGTGPRLDRSGSGPIIVVQHAAQALTTLDLSRASEVASFGTDELVAQSLMIALAVIMSNEVLNGFPQRLLAEEDHAIQA